jgi:hypothetical protein
MSTHNADTVDALEPAVGLLRLGVDEVVEALRATLFHTLEAKAEVDGEVLPKRLVGFEDVDPAEDGALVICGACEVTNEYE